MIGLHLAAAAMLAHNAGAERVQRYVLRESALDELLRRFPRKSRREPPLYTEFCGPQLPMTRQQRRALARSSTGASHV